ncbi:MAG TPA: DUF5047 domain-containing protein [Streptomyces sp.]
MIATSAALQHAITGSHGVTLRVTAHTPTQGVLTGLPLTGGEIRVDCRSQVRRTGTLVFGDPSLWPADPADALTPFGSELQVEYGVVFADGTTEWVPVLYGAVQDAAIVRPNGAVEVEVADLSQAIADDRLEGPGQTNTAATVVAEITRLIQETRPPAVVTDRTGNTALASALVIERERWGDGVERLADAIGAEVYADTVGGFVIRPQPTLTDTWAWTVQGGGDGVLVKLQERATRERVYNKVIAFGQPQSGTVYTGTAVDNDTASPTYYGGPFGKKPRFYSSPLLTSQAAADEAAATLLARFKGLQAAITLETLVNPALEGGDVIKVILPDGRSQTHLVDSFTLPLQVDSAMRITSRTLDLPAESS